MNTKTPYFGNFGIGDVAVFCGAGISYNSGLPLAKDLKQYILEKLPIDKKDIKEISEFSLPFEAFMEAISENIDISKILEIFEKGEPNANHILIAKLAKKGYIKMIFTTNFDLLIEKALEKEELKRNIDFEVYHNEEQFSRINFENVEPDKVRIFKIHGSVANIDSLRTTMKLVASKTLSDKRFNAIRYLFSTGNHKKVLILGYSCSDELDITPQIQSIEESQKEIIFIDHHSDIEKIEDIKIKDVKNPFKKFNGRRIICKTDNFIEKLWDSYKEMIGVYESVKFEAQWKAYIDNWVRDLEENEGLFIAYFIIGLLFQNISNFNKSIEYYEKSLEIVKHIEFIPAESKKGQENLEDILIVLRRSMNKVESTLYMNIGNAYYGIGDFNKSIEYNIVGSKIAKDIGDKEGESKSYGNLGNAYDRLGKFREAIKYHEKNLKIAKDINHRLGEAACYRNLGDSYTHFGVFNKSVELYEKSLEIAKDIGDKAGESACYGNLGYVYANLENFKKAIISYEKSLEIAKIIGSREIEATVYLGLGYTYHTSENYKKAIEYYLKAEKMLNEIGQIYYLKLVQKKLSLAYKEVRDNDDDKKIGDALRINSSIKRVDDNLKGVMQNSIRSEIEKEYRTNTKINPNDAKVHIEMGNLLINLDRLEEAEKEYRKAIEINSESPEAHYNLGVLLKDLRKYEEAEGEYKKAIKIGYDNKNILADAHYSLGNLLDDLERFEEAEKEYKEALRINPIYAEAHNNFGLLLAKLNRSEEAEKEYKEALRINPNYAEAHGNIGLLLWITRKRNEAEVHFNKLLSVKPDLKGWVEGIKRSY